MGKRKILHIQVLPKLSGVQKVSLEIFKNLPPDFDKYILFSGSSEYGDVSECIKEFEATGAKVLLSDNLKREISLKDDVKAFKEIYSLCKNEKFDIVHTNSTKPGIIGRIAATLARVPYVLHTIHGLSFHKFVKWHKWIFYWLCEMFASLFCNEITTVNAYYTKYFKWCKGKVKVIHNGLRYEDFPVIERPDNNGELIKILFVGRLDIPKNPLHLLKVADYLRKKYNNIEFTIVGDGDLFEECQKYIVEHDLSECVKLEGWKTDVYQYYSSHDILAIPSIYEAFGLIFLEAGYYNLPTVATNVEGIPEVIEDGVTGLLCSPDDVESFASNIEKLIKDKALRIEMGKRAHDRVVSKFNAGKMVSQFINLYNRKN